MLENQVLVAPGLNIFVMLDLPVFALGDAEISLISKPETKIEAGETLTFFSVSSSYEVEFPDGVKKKDAVSEMIQYVLEEDYSPTFLNRRPWLSISRSLLPAGALSLYASRRPCPCLHLSPFPYSRHDSRMPRGRRHVHHRHSSFLLLPRPRLQFLRRHLRLPHPHR